jgi:DNA-binding NarL/FixJ family response regulator
MTQPSGGARLSRRPSSGIDRSRIASEEISDQRPRSRTLKVVIADEALLTRAGIASVVRALDGIELSAVCEDVDSLRDAIDEAAPHVVLTTIELPPDYTDEGIQVADELRRKHPHVGVVVLSRYAEPRYVSVLFASGPEGRAYLLKEHIKDPGELERAIREVARGGALLDPRIAQTMLRTRYSPAASQIARLTKREREVLALIAAAHSNSAIATQLGIAKDGVERHVNTIFAKLALEHGDLSPRVQATRMFLASETGLSDEPRRGAGPGSCAPRRPRARR